MIQALKEAGADLDRADSEGSTALITAVKHRNHDAVATLVELGADMNIPDKDGNTAPIWASRKDDPGLVDAVMCGWRELDKDCRNAQGDTALATAVKGGHTAALKALLAWSFDVAVPDAAGNTPLICAVMSDIPSAADLLLNGKQRVHLLKKTMMAKRRWR